MITRSSGAHLSKRCQEKHLLWSEDEVGGEDNFIKMALLVLDRCPQLDVYMFSFLGVGSR